MGSLYSGDFVGYRIASSAEHDAALSKAVVAVDANVLLDLYRFRPQTSTDLISVLRSIGDRLVVPHQSLREFWRHRQRSAGTPRTATKAATDSVRKFERSVTDAVGTWAKAVGTDQGELEDLQQTIGDFVDSLSHSLEAALTDDEEGSEDSVLVALEELLDGRVTEALPPDQYAECLAEARRRIEAEEPPGFRDAPKEDDGPEEGGAGDYLVWHQATRHALARDSDLIIVTRDEKEDWWWRRQAAFVGPHPELTREFHELGGRRLYLLRPADLLDRASVLDVAVDEDSRSDAARVGEAASRDKDGETPPSESHYAPWTAEALTHLLSALEIGHPVQAAALRLATPDVGGLVSRDAVYELGNYPADRVLRGFTRPFLRFTALLQEQGLVPSGVAPVFVAQYPDGVRTSYFSVPPEVPELIAQLEAGGPSS